MDIDDCPEVITADRVYVYYSDAEIVVDDEPDLLDEELQDELPFIFNPGE